MRNLQRIRKEVETGHTDFATHAPLFWSEICRLDEESPNPYEMVGSSEFELLRDFFGPIWRKYIAGTELLHVAEFGEKAAFLPILSQEGYRWGISVESEPLKNVPNVRNGAFVWCWPHPETLFWLAEAFPQVPFWIGIDADPVALDIASRLSAARFPNESRVSVRHGIGSEIDYSLYDVVFFANGLAGKAEIFRRLSEGLGKNGRAFVRNPVWWGRLLYEDFFDCSASGSFEVLERIRSSAVGETLFIKKSHG